MEKPTLDDIRACLAVHLKKKLEDITRAKRNRIADASSKGHLGAGRLPIWLYEDINPLFEAGISLALGEAKRIERLTAVSPTQLRPIVGELLENFTLQVCNLMTLNGPLSDKQQKIAADRVTPKFWAHHHHALRQFDVGLLELEEPNEAPSMTNNFNNFGSMHGGAVQQGTTKSSQTQIGDVNVNDIEAALTAVVEAIKSERIEPETDRELAADIATIRAQLSKSSPSKSIMQETAASMKRIAEGAGGGALAVPAVAAFQALFAAVGMS